VVSSSLCWSLSLSLSMFYLGLNVLIITSL